MLYNFNQGKSSTNQLKCPYCGATVAAPAATRGLRQHKATTVKQGIILSEPADFVATCTRCYRKFGIKISF